MDLIYTDAQLTDIGVMKDFLLDMAYGSDENDFELTTSINNNVLDDDYCIYIEGTEYGGIIDGIAVNTADKKITYKGRTWHGVLNSKIIQPNAGSDYLILSGDVNSIIGTLLSRCGLTGLFQASTSTIRTLANYQFNRYIPLYDGIAKMLSEYDLKLNMAFNGSKVILSAVNAFDYSDVDEFSNDQLEFNIESYSNTVNHLICLGSGELSQRTVVHLYVDNTGAIRSVPYYTGTAEITAIYDYPNAESVDELTNGGIEELRKLSDVEKISININNERQYDIGDIVGGYEIVTGLSVNRKVSKKIVKIENEQINIEYKVGD